MDFPSLRGGNEVGGQWLESAPRWTVLPLPRGEGGKVSLLLATSYSSIRFH